jgi:putative oxidoreductase
MHPPLASVLVVDDDAAVARVALGAVMFPHGAQKLLGWFGGYGFQGTMGFLTGQAGLPYPIALLVILIESIGALALVMLRGSGAASVDRALSA